MESHLLQMRGLKHGIDRAGNRPSKSHLLQIRGLKQRKGTFTATQLVASFTDAWIETSFRARM